MAEKLANNAASTLNGGINDITQTIVVSNGTVFPASSSFRIIIDSELILVGSRSGNTFSSCTRGVEGTSAASHSNGAAVTHVLTTEGLRQYLEDALKDGTALGSAADTNLYRSAADILKTDDTFTAINVGGRPAASGNEAMFVDVSGDTQRRFQVLGSGAMYWGPGNAALDTNLYRSAANTLKTDDSFVVAGAFAVTGASGKSTIDVTDTTGTVGITLGTDTNLYRGGANLLKTDDSFSVIRAGASEVSYYSTVLSSGYHVDYYVSGEANARLSIAAGGALAWGPGSAGVDTNLYRSAADTLKSDDGIWGVGGLVTKTKAGVPSDTDLVTGMQQSGAMILDTTNSRIYFRVGSTWKYAALT